jgi:RNase H-like domain found in reverse transcriptase
MQVPTNIKQIRAFLGMVGYYHDMWPFCSHILAPLTELTGKNAFVWEDKHQQAFEQMKALIAMDALLAYPNHDKLFDIKTDASDYQLSARHLTGQPSHCLLHKKAKFCAKELYHYRKRTLKYCWNPQRVLIHAPWSTNHNLYRSQEFNSQTFQFQYTAPYDGACFLKNSVATTSTKKAPKTLLPTRSAMSRCLAW